MSFLEYDHKEFSIPLKNITQQKTTLYIPLNSDSFMILKTNNEYQVYSIRNAQMICSGQIPKQFNASQYMTPITYYKQKHVFFFNNEGNICKLRYKDNISQVRLEIMPQKSKPGAFSVDYRVLDRNAQFILGWVQNTSSMSCNIFLYDWVANTYSNYLNLGSNFFNLFISNLSQNLQSSYFNPMEKLPEIKFLVISEDDKRIYYNLLSLSAEKRTCQNNETKVSRLAFSLKQRGKKFLNIQNFPRVAYYHDQMLYLFTNYRQGQKLVIVSMEDNKFIILPIIINGFPQKQRGLIRKNFGVVDKNLVFTVHFITLNQEYIYQVPLNWIKDINSNTKNFQIVLVHKEAKYVKNQHKGYQSSYFISLDGCSFHKSEFKYEKISRLCIKQNENLESLLSVDITYGIPKNYFYHQMGESLNFSSQFIHQIIQLL